MISRLQVLLNYDLQPCTCHRCYVAFNGMPLKSLWKQAPSHGQFAQMQSRMHPHGRPPFEICLSLFGMGIYKSLLDICMFHRSQYMSFATFSTKRARSFYMPRARHSSFHVSAAFFGVVFFTLQFARPVPTTLGWCHFHAQLSEPRRNHDETTTKPRRNHSSFAA